MHSAAANMGNPPTLSARRHGREARPLRPDMVEPAIEQGEVSRCFQPRRSERKIAGLDRELIIGQQPGAEHAHEDGVGGWRVAAGGSGTTRKNKGDARPNPRVGVTLAEALRRASRESTPRPVSSAKIDLKKKPIGNPRAARWIVRTAIRP